jgi:hypothetical protein
MEFGHFNPFVAKALRAKAGQRSLYGKAIFCDGKIIPESQLR